jgi:hypothetical protein
LIADDLDADANILTSGHDDESSVSVGRKQSRVQKQLSGNLVPIRGLLLRDQVPQPELAISLARIRERKKVGGGKRKKKLP